MTVCCIYFFYYVLQFLQTGLWFAFFCFVTELSLHILILTLLTSIINVQFSFKSFGFYKNKIIKISILPVQVVDSYYDLFLAIVQIEDEVVYCIGHNGVNIDDQYRCVEIIN